MPGQADTIALSLSGWDAHTIPVPTLSPSAEMESIPPGMLKLRELIHRENIKVFSSNYALYGDLSRRVGDTLTSMVPTMETYSIDESFLHLTDFREREVESMARELRGRVLRWSGIPACVGIAPTKMLAKVGNFIAKKRPHFAGVCDLRSAAVRAELLACLVVAGAGLDDGARSEAFSRKLRERDRGEIVKSSVAMLTGGPKVNVGAAGIAVLQKGKPFHRTRFVVRMMPSPSVGAMERATSQGARANRIELLAGPLACEGRGSVRCEVA